MDFPIADLELHQQLESPPALVELQQLRGMRDVDVKNAMGQGLRFRSMQQEAMRVGSQAGLSKRYEMIMEYLDANESKVNVIFSFAGLVNDGRVLVPAIHQAQNQFRRDGGDAHVITNSYTIADEAQIVSSIPTWRDWVYQEYAAPLKPHHSLLPRTKSEIKEWETWVKKGWRAGVAQADDIFSDRLNELTRAVEGRYLYRVLEQKGMIQPSSLHVEHNEVMYNGRTMNVGEVIYSIQRPANYTAGSDWRPVWTK